MLDIKDLRCALLRPTLTRCGLWTRASENLLVGTGLVESEFKFLVQHPGPALSPWQIEPKSFTSLIARLSMDKELMMRVLNVLGMATLPTDANHLVGNMTLACIVARLKYWYNATPLPNADNVEALAKYWAKIYNTRNDPKDIKRFVYLYDQYGEHNSD